MKKSIIAAGAASVALAAMPLAGVFADFSGGPFKDIIQTTVGETCTFARGTQEAHTATVANYHAEGQSWTLGQDTTTTPDPTVEANTDTLAPVTVTPAAAGAAETPLGNSKFYVICNDQQGYVVTVNATDLTTTSQVHSWNYANDRSSSTGATASYWRITPSDGDIATDPTPTNFSDIANNIISKRTSAEDGHDFSVAYSAFALTGQDSGTYKASATYTAAQL